MYHKAIYLGGQLAVREQEPFKITHKHEYGKMSKLQVQVELVEILTDILEMEDIKKIAKNLCDIPYDRLPNCQKERTERGTIVLQKTYNSFRLSILQNTWKMELDANGIIEEGRTKDAQFRNYLLSLYNETF